MIFLKQYFHAGFSLGYLQNFRNIFAGTPPNAYKFQKHYKISIKFR